MISQINTDTSFWLPPPVFLLVKRFDMAGKCSRSDCFGPNEIHVAPFDATNLASDIVGGDVARGVNLRVWMFSDCAGVLVERK